LSREFRLIPERFSITNSIIEVELIGPDTLPNIPDSFAPLVFAKLVDFSGTTFRKGLNLPSTQFMGDVRLTGALLANENINLIKAYFANEAEFQCLKMVDQDRTKFRAIQMRGATFSGRLRFDCQERTEIGDLNLSEVRVLGPAARFDNIDFFGTLDLSLAQITPKAFLVGAQFMTDPSFNGTTFSGGVAFNGGKFAKGADFRRAAFGKGSTASFDGVTFKGDSFFQATRFEAAADFSGVTASTASFDFTDATFEGEAHFHGSTLAVASFENARFTKSVSFAQAVIGPVGSCGAPGAIALDFNRVVFDGLVDLVSTKIMGALNFSHVNFKPGELLVSWTQLDGYLSHGSLSLKRQASCPLHCILVANSSTPVPEEFYRRLEENFRKQNRLSDATSAYFLKEEAAREEQVHSGTGLPGWMASTATSLDRWIWGYGVRPWFVFRAWVIGLAAFGLVYFFAPVPITSGMKEFVLPKLEITSLPVETAMWQWPPTQAALSVDPRGPVRLLRALHVSFIAGTGIRIGSPSLQLGERSLLRTLVIVERILGQIMFALLIVSTAQSIPHLGDVFSTLLK
jgi:uncharacterized protein YjbI with pentapeptide repeats